MHTQAGVDEAEFLATLPHSLRLEAVHFVYGEVIAKVTVLPLGLGATRRKDGG